MNTKNAHKATYHHYFVTAILKYASENEFQVADVFGVGEDEFVVSLYPFSNMIYRIVDAHSQTDAGRHWKDSQLFGLMVNVAYSFWGAVEREDYDEMEAEMPCPDEFELDVQRYLDSLP